MKAIVLTRGRIASVDDEDFDRVNQFKWQAIKSGNTYYAVRMETRLDGSRRTVRMHRFILGLTPRDERVDHENGCGVDNWRGNLRRATCSQNAANSGKAPGMSSRFKGVRWHAPDKRWQARICKTGVSKHLGYFKDEEAAARAYDTAAKERFGRFAKLNFP